MLLAHADLFHPGQIILTDDAFTWSQDLQLTVCEVYDHGIYHVKPVNKQVCFKELIPCMTGRQPLELQRLSGDEIIKMSKGYFDAPSLDHPVCICFCYVPMPRVRILTFMPE
jgi:hypothetical protein